MRLSRIEIHNFRRIRSADIKLSPASFLIGRNNSGKSSVIKAIEALLTLVTPKPEDFHRSPNGEAEREMMITGHFSGIPQEVSSMRGFKGRVVNGEFIYRKKFRRQEDGKVTTEIEALQYPYRFREPYNSKTKFAELCNEGFTEVQLTEWFGKPTMPSKNWELYMPPEAGIIEWCVDQEPSWFADPGGIPQNVNSRLPRLLHIPSFVELVDFEKADDEKKSKLGECLNLLFTSLLEGNELANNIQALLAELELQMDPTQQDSLVGGMCSSISDTIKEVFPDCGFSIRPSLQTLNEVLKPKYQVDIVSNVPTDTGRQGTGLIRTVLFSMLRYHANTMWQLNAERRPLLVAFEEPEIYLHPSAANLLRDTIYALGLSDQIVCTSHSPWMIDLSKDPQSVTRLAVDEDGAVSAFNFGVSETLRNLQEEDRCRVKMLQCFDDELSRVFFADRVIVVEGDSEQVAINETLKKLPHETCNEFRSSVQVVKARGKASIISLVRYLKALNIPFKVIHDRDQGIEGAERFNAPILEAVGDDTRVFILEECLEDVLGYTPPKIDKPFRVFEAFQRWNNFNQIPARWRTLFMAMQGESGMALAAAAMQQED